MLSVWSRISQYQMTVMVEVSQIREDAKRI